MKPYTLYYYIPEPDSLVWRGECSLREQGYVIDADYDDGTYSCFVDKDVMDNYNGL